MTEIKIDNENLLTLLKELIRINSANPSLSGGGSGELQIAQYRRGALDMKGGLAAQIMAVQSIIESGRTLKGDIILTHVADFKKTKNSKITGPCLSVYLFYRLPYDRLELFRGRSARISNVYLVMFSP